MKRFLKILLVIFLLISGALGFAGYKLFSLPDSSEMKTFFFEHRQAFEQKNTSILSALRQQKPIATTGNSVIGYQWIQLEPEYPQTGKPMIIRYYTHLRGIGVGSFGTGIAYINPEATEKLYPTLEAMNRDAKKTEGFLGYSSITGHWYAFRWEAD